jgi:hypothetical protein
MAAGRAESLHGELADPLPCDKKRACAQGAARRASSISINKGP